MRQGNRQRKPARVKTAVVVVQECGEVNVPMAEKCER